MNLLVVGNGFDLVHNLPTLYSDSPNFNLLIITEKLATFLPEKFGAKGFEYKFILGDKVLASVTFLISEPPTIKITGFSGLVSF